MEKRVGEVVCDNCNKLFIKKLYRIKRSKLQFCCVSCLKEYRKPKPKPCLNCGKDTVNPKFCDGSCAATYNNPKKPKRDPKVAPCKTCNNLISKNRTYCDSCLDSKKQAYINRITFTTLQDLWDNEKYKGPQVYNLVRSHSRSAYMASDRAKSCAICGYSSISKYAT